jgi:hypothetical protein
MRVVLLNSDAAAAGERVRAQVLGSEFVNRNLPTALHGSLGLRAVKRETRVMLVSMRVRAQLGAILASSCCPAQNAHFRVKL